MSANESSVPYGYCECGCGQKTAIAWRNYHDRGIRKGEPMRFVHPHQSRHKGSPEKRFWSRVKKTDTCWLWSGHHNESGYAMFNVEKKPVRAHRFAYELLVGPIPVGLHLDHLCRNRGCVNPDHLEPVTPAENLRRGPDWSGNRTHCPHGHDYTPENTIIRPDGCRTCRTCRNAQQRRWYASRKAKAQ